MHAIHGLRRFELIRYFLAAVTFAWLASSVATAADAPAIGSPAPEF